MPETATQSDQPNPTPLHRTILAVDIENSTTRTDPVKAHLRQQVYSMVEEALQTAGIKDQHRDPFIDRGDGVLVLIHPVDQAPKTLLLNPVIPTLSKLLARHNVGLPPTQHERLLRLRAVLHAGEIHYDDNGCFGEALDITFRLLDAPPLKKSLQQSPAPLALVISRDIFSALVRHRYEGIDDRTFEPLVRVHVAGQRHQGWVQIPPNTGTQPSSPTQGTVDLIAERAESL